MFNDCSADIRSLAVLPFANLSGDPAQDDLSEVVTDNMVKILSKVGGLFDVSASATEPFGDLVEAHLVALAGDVEQVRRHRTAEVVRACLPRR